MISKLSFFKTGKTLVSPFELQDDTKPYYIFHKQNALRRKSSQSTDLVLESMDGRRKMNKMTKEEQNSEIANYRKTNISSEQLRAMKTPINIQPLYGKLLLNQGDILDGKWKVESLIGEGTFGQIYKAINVRDKTPVAIKCEAFGKGQVETLRVETVILKKSQSSPHVPRFISAGITKEFRFLIMSCCGQNLHHLNACDLLANPNQEKTTKHALPIKVILEFGLQMISCIESFHNCGFIHRDIKPSNFVFDSQNGQLKLIDFNLARRYVDRNGDLKKERPRTGFRGTGRYASIAAHEERDLGRKDDLWSMFYSIIELAGAALPWAAMSNFKEIHELKIRNHDSSLFENIPQKKCFIKFMNHLNTLKFADEPDYDYLVKLMTDALIDEIQKTKPLLPTLKIEIPSQGTVVKTPTKKKSKFKLESLSPLGKLSILKSPNRRVVPSPKIFKMYRRNLA